LLAYLTSGLASALGIGPLTLLTVVARGQSHEQLLKHLSEQVDELDLMSIRKKWPSEFQDGLIAPMEVGRWTPFPKI